MELRILIKKGLDKSLYFCPGKCLSRAFYLSARAVVKFFPIIIISHHLSSCQAKIFQKKIFLSFVNHLTKSSFDDASRARRCQILTRCGSCKPADSCQILISCGSYISYVGRRQILIVRSSCKSCENLTIFVKFSTSCDYVEAVPYNYNSSFIITQFLKSCKF